MKILTLILLTAALGLPHLTHAEKALIEEERDSALEALNRNRSFLIQSERYLAERMHGKNESGKYMDYFELGLNSRTGAIMIEGGANQWLEIAFARGHSARTIFLQGYRHGKLDGKHTGAQSGSRGH